MPFIYTKKNSADINDFRENRYFIATGVLPTDNDEELMMDPVETETLQITDNGNYDVRDYAEAAVDITADKVTSGTKTISDNGIYTVTTYKKAKVQVTADKVDTGTITISNNGTVDVIGYAEANVDVPASAVVDGTIDIWYNGTFDVTDYASANVDIPEPSGSMDITENGTYDVTTYSEAVVDVPGIEPSGYISITENGTYDVTDYAEAYVDIEPLSPGTLYIYSFEILTTNSFPSDILNKLAPGYSLLPIESPYPTYSGTLILNDEFPELPSSSDDPLVLTSTSSDEDIADFFDIIINYTESHPDMRFIDWYGIDGMLDILPDDSTQIFNDYEPMAVLNLSLAISGSGVSCSLPTHFPGQDDVLHKITEVCNLKLEYIGSMNL